MKKRDMEQAERNSYLCDIETAKDLMARNKNAKTLEDLSGQDLDKLTRLTNDILENIGMYKIPEEWKSAIYEFYIWNQSLGGYEE